MLVDEDLTVDVRYFVMVTIGIIVTLASILVFTPIFLLPFVLLLWLACRTHADFQMQWRSHASLRMAFGIDVHEGAAIGQARTVKRKGSRHWRV
jgi:hypothetical protein